MGAYPSDVSMSPIDQNTSNQQQEQQSRTSSIIFNSNGSVMSSTDPNTSNQQPKRESVTDSSHIISPSPQQVPCQYGEKCYRKTPDHFKKYSHPHKPLADPIESNPSSTDSNTCHQQPKQQSVTDSSNIMSPSPQQIPCRYGEKCYRKNPDHFKKYSHPHKSQDSINDQPLDTEFQYKESHQNTNSEKVAEIQVELEAQQQIAQIHLELVEKQFLASIADIQNKNKYLEEAIEKLREEKMKMAKYHQQLENALQQELDNRERREIEKQRILEIRRDTPSYWGINAFDQPYREVDIRPESPEFKILCELLNDTIETHGDNYGTIYGKDPTAFIVTKVTRIHNKKLWHEYCFKKESIIEKNDQRLADCESSKYLKDHPLLVPLLDANANEYWLFHGCDDEIVPFLLNTGYDPRVSSLDGMFGGGFYLAENSSKSNQYIPCPGCGKYAIFHDSGCSCKNQENLEFSIILYRAVLGDVHIVKQYDTKTYRGEKPFRVRRPPYKENSVYLYDSVMGESIKNGGNKLQYREFILYETGQAYPEYLIKFKRSAANARAPSDIKRMKDKCYYFLKNTFNKMHE